MNLIPRGPFAVVSQTSGVPIALYPSDPAYSFELQRATDSAGTGATSIATAIPGTQEVYIDPQPTDGVTWWYRIRCTGYGDTPSSWTNWISGVATQLPDGATRPAPVLPSFAETRSISGTTATVTIGVTDPQSRVSLIEFQTKSGTGAASGWVTDATPPYAASVGISAPESTVEYRITAYDMNGVSQIVTQKSVSFIPGQNLLLIKAALVAGSITKTSFDVDITVTDPSATAATMTLSHTEQGCTVARTGGGFDPLTTTGGTFRYTVTRSSTADAGSGGSTFTVSASGRVDGTLFIPADAQDLDAAATITLSVKPDGSCPATLSGHNNTASWMYFAVSGTSPTTPSDATVLASGTVVNGRIAELASVATLALGQRCILKAIPFTGASATGTAGQSVVAQVDRQNKTTTKTLQVAHTLFQPASSSDSVARALSATTTGAKTNVLFFAWVPLPAGATITAWRFKGTRNNGNGSLSCDLYRMDSPTLVSSLTHTTTGIQIPSASTSLFIGSEMYMVLCSIDTSSATNANDNQLYYVEFDYSAPNLDTSI
jgi:hypothetical protein